MTETESTTSTPKPTTPSGASSATSSEPTDALSVLDLSTFLFAGKKDKRSKAARLLVTGRLRVFRVLHNYIAAECRGDSGEIYKLLWVDDRWSCSCPARTDCSHLNALWAVVAVNR